jgi:hypothetical protein
MSATCQFCSTDINASDPTHCQTRAAALKCHWLSSAVREKAEAANASIAAALAKITRRQAFAQARSMSARQYRSLPNWAFAKDLFLVGSTLGWALCEEMGIDPDARTASPWPDPTPTPLDRALTPAERKRLRGGPQPKGYAAPPGSGPAGETCGTCDHLARVQPGNRSFPKCGLMERGWTGGTASDVRVRSPACSRWAPLSPSTVEAGE